MDFDEREALRQRHVTFGVSLPITLVEVVDRLADARGWTTAATIKHLIRGGLKAEAAAETAKRA